MLLCGSGLYDGRLLDHFPFHQHDLFNLIAIVGLVFPVNAHHDLGHRDGYDIAEHD
jgi:hypothetical protein